jgi:D-lactate dehydrogenase (cytochrome)
MSALPQSHPEALSQLRLLLDDRLSTNASILEQHGRDEGYIKPVPPDAVVFPESAGEVQEIARICHRHRIPMIPFGVGTSLEGQIIPIHGGISIDCSRMNRVLEVNAADLDVRLEPGVTRRQLNEHLRDQGLFFPVDPGADATLGGMASTRASGTNAVRYGTMRDNVLALTVVMADGKLLHTGTRARKSAAGYDLTALFVGAEGTLGIITSLSLRLYGREEAISSAVCAFDSLKGAVDTVIETIQMGIPIARIELLDEVLMGAVNRYSKLGYALKPTLFLEFHGTPMSVKEQAEAVGEICSEHGGDNFQWTAREEDRRVLWRARHDVAYACKLLRPDSRLWATDVCVPISRLTECIVQTRRDIDQSKLIAPIVGHVGDGNFHVTMMLDTSDEEEMARAHAFNERLVDRALAMGGTSTGEHGIGISKRHKLVAEHGDAVSVMHTIKHALDPMNLMNPGKLFLES